jgi:hypothetical protein
VKKWFGRALFALGAGGVLPLLLGIDASVTLRLQGYWVEIGAIALFVASFMCIAAGFCLIRSSDPIDESSPSAQDRQSRLHPTSRTYRMVSLGFNRFR